MSNFGDQHDGGFCGSSLPLVFCYGSWWVFVALCRSPDAKYSCSVWSWIALPPQPSMDTFLVPIFAEGGTNCSHLLTLNLAPWRPTAMLLLPQWWPGCASYYHHAYGLPLSVSVKSAQSEPRWGRAAGHLLQGDRLYYYDYTVLAGTWLSLGVGRVWDQAGVFCSTFLIHFSTVHGWDPPCYILSLFHPLSFIPSTNM